MSWWAFSTMRGDGRPRDWLRWSELLEAVRAEIPALGWNDVRAALRAGPQAERRYGHKRYRPEHMEAVRAYAAARGFYRRNG